MQIPSVRARRGSLSSASTSALVAAIVLAAVSAGCGGEPARAGSASTDPVAAVVLLRAEACAGSRRLNATGVAVSETVIATVAHTFDHGRSVELVDHDGDRRDAEIIWLDVERDLALLQVKEPMPLWLPLGESEDGDAVTVMTAASSASFDSKPATVLQHTTATVGGAGERAAIEIAAGIAPGDSGAPVLNGHGEVIGVVFATSKSEDRGWVIAAQEIEAALAQPKDGPISLNC